jgi:hypothetical protein
MTRTFSVKAIAAFLQLFEKIPVLIEMLSHPDSNLIEPRRHRTCDPQIKSLLLCQLS